MPELKKIDKNEVFILMDNHPGHKRLNIIIFIKKKSIRLSIFLLILLILNL